MSNPYVPKNVRMPPTTGIKDGPTRVYADKLNQAVNGAFSGFISTILATLGIQQIEYGTMNFASPSTSVTFAAPMPNATYALVIAPLFIPSAIAKTATGFTITGTYTGAVDWIAIS